MTDEKIIELLVKIQVVVGKAIVFVDKKEYQKAINALSYIYTLGIGRIMEDLKVRGQGTCEHQYVLETHGPHKVCKKCRKCGLREIVAELSS